MIFYYKTLLWSANSRHSVCYNGYYLIVKNISESCVKQNMGATGNARSYFTCTIRRCVIRPLWTSVAWHVTSFVLCCDNKKHLDPCRLFVAVLPFCCDSRGRVFCAFVCDVLCQIGGSRETCTGLWWEKLNERDHLEDLGLERSMQLKWS